MFAKLILFIFFSNQMIIKIDKYIKFIEQNKNKNKNKNMQSYTY
jgi:hypothetical protein